VNPRANVVDDLAQLANLAEPPPLDEVAAHRLVERALATTSRALRVGEASGAATASGLAPRDSATTGDVDELAHLAGLAEPQLLDEVAAHRVVERALGSGKTAGLRGTSRPRRGRVWAPTLALGCAAVVAWLALRGAPAPEFVLSSVSLPTGDRLTALPGARYDVSRLEPADRRLRLHHGTILADVAHVVRGQRFEIATTHLVAIATGTVFSVDTDAIRSRVVVYEGSVVVEQAGVRHVLAAGGGWDSALGVGAPFVAELAPAITAALSNRAAAADPTPLPPPASTDHVASAPTEPPPANPVGSPPPSEPPPPTASPPSLAELLARAHAQIAGGRYDAALATAKLAASRGGGSGAWRLVTADALRGLGRAADAARELDAAHRELAGLDAVEAGYSAAYLRFRELHDPAGALASLADVDALDSPLEERGLGLRVQILESLGHHNDARPLAARYLERFPQGDLRVLMQSLRR
jgi:hypothetical protein